MLGVGCVDFNTWTSNMLVSPRSFVYTAWLTLCSKANSTSDTWIRVSGFRVPVFGFRVSGFGTWVSGSGLRNLDDFLL